MGVVLWEEEKVRVVKGAVRVIVGGEVCEVSKQEWGRYASEAPIEGERDAIGTSGGVPRPHHNPVDGFDCEGGNGSGELFVVPLEVGGNGGRGGAGAVPDRFPLGFEGSSHALRVVDAAALTRDYV